MENESSVCNTPTPVCEHTIIEDLIDINPDRSKYVYYCANCYMCFDTINVNLSNTTRLDK